MMEAAQAGALAGAEHIGADAPVTLGITVLTSMDQATLEQTGVRRPMQEQVASLAQLAHEAGISGVVASPQEARELRELLGPDAYIVTWAAAGDQSRIATPAQAFDNGASHIVVGRPITDAPDPIAAFESIIEELS